MGMEITLIEVCHKDSLSVSNQKTECTEILY